MDKWRVTTESGTIYNIERRYHDTERKDGYLVAIRTPKVIDPERVIDPESMAYLAPEEIREYELYLPSAVGARYLLYRDTKLVVGECLHGQEEDSEEGSYIHSTPIMHIECVNDSTNK